MFVWSILNRPESGWDLKFVDPTDTQWGVMFSALNWTLFTTFLQKKSCSKGILPVPVFYEWCRAPAESDPRWSWSDRKPPTASPPWKECEEGTTRQCVSWASHTSVSPALSYSRALLISSAARSMSALRMAARGMETCSEMEEKGGLSLSAAEQDIGHNSRQRETIESTTTCVQRAQDMKTYIMYILYWLSGSKPMNYLWTLFLSAFKQLFIPRWRRLPGGQLYLWLDVQHEHASKTSPADVICNLTDFNLSN